MMVRQWMAYGLAAVSTAALCTQAHAGVVSVSGSAKSTVVQYAGIFPIQTDFNQETVPLTQALPPATARARLDRLLDDNTITAAGQALAIFDRADLSTESPPNDVGLDLGAFSDDNITTWFVEGAVTEKRTIVLNTADLAPDAATGSVFEVSSRVLLSGVMLITAAQTGGDLSGARTNFSFSVTLSQDGRDTTTPISGDVTLVGTDTGDAQVDSPSGAMSGLFLPIIDFTDQITDLPLVRAVAFAGTNFPYKYSIIVGQPFTLELTVRSQVFTVPGGVGAAAVFGLPQGQLGDVLSRIKHNDSGQKLSDAVSKKVDTTGAAYANTPVNAPPSTLPLFSACGVLGMESAAFALLAACLCVMRSGMRISRRHSQRE